MIKTCRICGKPFEAKNPLYVGCSPECRKKNALMNTLKSMARHPEREKARKKLYHIKTYKPKLKACKHCGKPTENGCRSYCDDCLFTAYEDEKLHNWAAKVLLCRGLDKEAVLYELELRKQKAES